MEQSGVYGAPVAGTAHFSTFYTGYAADVSALRRLLSDLREQGCNRLTCLIGPGADEDAASRRALGETAAAYATLTVLTEDPDCGDNFDAAAQEIAAGFAAGADCRIIPNRVEAIGYCLDHCGRADTALLLRRRPEDAGSPHLTDEQIITQYLETK